MSNFPSTKKSPAESDMKTSTHTAAQRQQGFQEMNKRRAFLQDNSWIKKRPEEEKDENYGRVVLNRHNSHDALDRKMKERDEPKATISRYRSDDTLDRTLSTFRSPEKTKSRPGGLMSANTPTPTPTASTSAMAPVKKKRQSWFPPPPPGSSVTPNTGGNKRDPALHPPIPPKPSSPVPSSNQLSRNNRYVHSPKPGLHTEAQKAAETNIRSQGLDDVIWVSPSLQQADKGEEMDNLIKMNKSLNRNQGLDGLFRANLKAEQAEKRAQSLESLIFMNTRMDKDSKGNQGFGSLKKINQRTDSKKGKQDLNELIKANPETSKSMKRGHSLNLTQVTPEVNRSDQGTQDLDKFIKVTPTVNKSSAQGLNELINVNPQAVKSTSGNQDLDKFIKVNPEILTTNQRNQDLVNTKVSSVMIGSTQSQHLDNLIKVRPSAPTNTNRDQDPEKLTDMHSYVTTNKNGRLDDQVNGSSNARHNESTGTSVYSYEVRNSLSSNHGTGHAGSKDTVVYTRTYVENSKSSKDRHQETISGKYIPTVYSTSDRSVIERDMCTYCRKPLGVETKMILDELQICCHSTCFKCEICKRPLENLQAGDSIWIYRQTIHCEPCYAKVMAKWIQ
uniref:Sciellin n=1 Tax=Jaculus jaculus TaxID=51337 RepID=A0A8C5NXK9_JACJA